MRWWRIWRRKSTAPKLFGEPATGTGAARADAHDRQAALVGAVGAEAKQAVDAGKARRVEQHVGLETLPALRSRQCGDQRHRVIGQRRGSHRLVAEFGAVAVRETSKARWIRRGVEAALQFGAREHARIVPQPGAEQLDVLQIGPGRGQRVGDRHHRVAIVGQQQRIGLTERLRHLRRRRRTIGAVFFERDDPPAPFRHRLLEARFHHIAIGVLGQHGRERSFADAGGVFDDPVDVRLRQEAQQIDATAGHACIGRERDHVDAARARRLRRRRNRQRKQRTQDDFRAFVERLLGRLLRALRAAAVILDQKLDIGVQEFRERHLGGFLHRFRRDGRIARRRQRQNQTDLDLPGTDRNRLLRRSRRTGRGLRTERTGKLAQALLHARASAKHRRAQNQAKRGPPGCPRTRNPGLRSQTCRLRLGIERAHHRISSLGRPRIGPGRRPPQGSGGWDSGILSANS